MNNKQKIYNPSLSDFLRLPMSNPSEVGLCPMRLARIDPAMQSYLGSNQVPGLLTVIARQGKLAHIETQGYANVETQKHIQPDAIFRIYSMTKPVTAVAVMLLYEQGKLFLDDPMANYLPEFSDMKVYTANGLMDAERHITIRHLLTHQSGLTYSMIPNVPEVSRMYEKAGVNENFSRLAGWNLEAFVKKLAELPLITQPGTAWRYSEGFSVLARLVEVISGQRYGEFLRQRLFEPLDMVDTGYWVPADKLHRLAALYEQRPDKTGFEATDGYGGDYSRNPALEVGGSGLVSTAADYLRFAQMLLNGGELDGMRLLSPTTVRMILSDHFGGNLGDQLPASVLPRVKGLGFGFGGSVVTDPIARGMGSKGEYAWSGWANTSFWIDPVEQLIGMVFTQLIPQPDVVLTLADRMRQMTYQALVQTNKKSFTP